MQTIIVEQDKHDPERITITVREENGFGHSVRVEKKQVPKLITDLTSQIFFPQPEK